MNENWTKTSHSKTGVLHRLPASLKLTLAVAIVMWTAMWPVSHALGLLLPAAIVLAAALIARVPAGYILKRLLWLEPIVVGTALLSVFHGGQYRWLGFVLLVSRSTIALLTMMVLSYTTSISELLGVLRWLRVPGLLVTTIALAYRYLFVLADESLRMRRARASRTLIPRGGGHWWQWRITSGLIGRLFVRASERADRIYAAMCARGWR